MLATLVLLAVAAPTGFGDKLAYPTASRSDDVETYSGVKVPDPYHWMEDVDSPETRAWVSAEVKLTSDYLDAIPGRDKTHDLYSKLLNFEKFNLPEKAGRRYIYSRNSGLQNQSVVYVTDSLTAKPRVLLDPNALSKDGTIALNGSAATKDGRTWSYALSEAGSDWREWHFRDVATDKDLPDVLRWSKFSGGTFTNDGKGFFYGRYDEPKGQALKDTNYFQKLFFHRLGTAQSQDVPVYERPDHKDWFFSGNVTDDGRYFIIASSPGSTNKNRVFYKDLKAKNAKVVELIGNDDWMFNFLGNEGTTFFFQTDKDAPFGRVVAIDIGHPEEANWKTIVPEGKQVIAAASIVGHRLFLNRLQDAHSNVKVYDLAGKQTAEVELPGIGSAEGFGGRIDDKETFYSYMSYTTPPTIYRYDIRSGKCMVFKQPKVAFDGSKYETQQVFATSKDGAKVPIFLTYRKGTKMDGTNPTLMYGYGGFQVNETPYYSSSVATWLEMGGVYADVVLRGGTEYGEAWHIAGMKQNKQNVFNDFIAAGEWLIANKVTSTPKLAIRGGSNGGLLIGAMLTQRPDLWGAALAEVGVMDMLRFNKFTIGWAWMDEYGNPDTPEGFSYISKYSPLLNLKPGTHYPPTLITTADHDDRVFPAHSFKFAAEMQADQAGDAPVLIRIQTRGGHGAGLPTSKIIEQMTDEFSFLKRSLEMSDSSKG